MTLRQRVGKWLFPWQPRHERKEAVARARAQADQSREAAARSRRDREYFERSMADNHFAQRIAAQIMGGLGGNDRAR